MKNNIKLHKKQNRTKQLNEIEINNLTSKEFKVVFRKMFKEELMKKELKALKKQTKRMSQN